MSITTINGNLAWAIVAFHVLQHTSFQSISGINYEAVFSGKEINYKGGDRNKGAFEVIREAEFIVAFDSIKAMPVINTSLIKPVIPDSLYRKRSSFIGLLYSAKLLA